MTDTTEETVQNHVPQLSETVPSEPSNLEAAAAHDSRHHGYSLNNGPGLDTAHFSSGSLSNQEQHIAVHLTKTNSLDSPAGPDDNTAHILGPQLNGSAGLEDSLEDGEHSVEEICENESTLPAVTFKGEPRRDTLFADSAASNPDNHVESSNIAPDMVDNTVTTQPADGAELCFASGPTEDATGEGLSLAPVDVAVGAVNAEDAVIIMEAKTATEATRNGTPPHVVTARDVSENPPSSEAPKKLSVHDITEDEVDNVSLSALRWDPPPERPRFNLSFAGCGFLGKISEHFHFYPWPIRVIGYCRALRCMSIHPSVRPTLVTTLQPTIFHGSCSYLAQPLKYEPQSYWLWGFYVHFLGSSGTLKLV